MKKHVLHLTALFAIVLMACSDNSDSIVESQIDTSTPVLNDLDLWLRGHFTTPYNIEMLYKWDINNSSISRYLHPPYQSSVEPIANALLKVWIEPYTTLGGEDFIKKIAPRQIVFIGSVNYNQSGTITLGLAEAGTRITLFEIDYLDFSDINSVKRPLETIQHEYAHILNQTVPYDDTYGLINPENYTAQWFNLVAQGIDPLEIGFITDYAASSPDEDFAEMVAQMLTNSKEVFDAKIDGIENEVAQAQLRLKESIVVNYFKTSFDIDLYELQALAEEATQNLVN